MKAFNVSIRTIWVFSFCRLVTGRHRTGGYDYRLTGSHWAIYPDGAPEGCEADPGSLVPDSCCTDLAPQPAIIDLMGTTCYVTTNFLDDGFAVAGYFGCDGGVPTYGEGCVAEGLLPPGTDLGPFNNNAMSIDTCNDGCALQVSGQGCYKANDFSGIPQYASDTRSFFVYLDESVPCQSNFVSDPQPLPSQAEPGPFYAIYPDGAPDGCQAPAGAKVPTSCCLGLGPQPLATTFAETPCFGTADLSPDGSVVSGYLGCDNGVQTYGERCLEGGILPPGTDVEPLNSFVSSIDECNAGCGFQISGKGCYKINDFGLAPQFSNDTRQFYIYLDGPECISNVRYGKGKRGGDKGGKGKRDGKGKGFSYTHTNYNGYWDRNLKGK